MKSMRFLSFLFLTCMAYAVLRYNVFKGVEWAHLPLYVTNKALAWTSLLFLGLGLTLGSRYRELRKQAGLWSFYLAFAHVLISLMVLRPEYFPKLTADTGWTLTAEIVLLSGVVGFGFMLRYHLLMNFRQVKNIGHIRFIWIARIILMAVVAHVTFLGAPGWADPGHWPGGLPPITLLSAVTGIVFLLLLSKPEQQ